MGVGNILLFRHTNKSFPIDQPELKLSLFENTFNDFTLQSQAKLILYVIIVCVTRLRPSLRNFTFFSSIT